MYFMGEGHIQLVSQQKSCLYYWESSDLNDLRIVELTLFSWLCIISLCMIKRSINCMSMVYQWSWRKKEINKASQGYFFLKKKKKTRNTHTDSVYCIFIFRSSILYLSTAKRKKYIYLCQVQQRIQYFELYSKSSNK